MLTYIAAKFLLRGVVKSLIVNPTISATLSVLPQATVVNYTLMGHEIVMSTNDLLKFGFDKLYEKYGESELSFSVDKFNNTMYRIVPANDLARRFFKEYTVEQSAEEIMIDLDVVSKYLDVLAQEDLQKIDNLEKSLFETDEAILQILFDLNLSVKRANPSELSSQKSEQQLVDEVLQKNMGLVQKNVRKKSRIQELRKQGEVIDLPRVPYKPKSDEEKIDEILNKISGQMRKHQRVRDRLSG